MRSRSVIFVVSFLTAAVAVVDGCSSTYEEAGGETETDAGADAETSAPGSFGTACFPNATCLSPLICVQGLCLRDEAADASNAQADATTDTTIDANQCEALDCNGDDENTCCPGFNCNSEVKKCEPIP